MDRAGREELLAAQARPLAELACALLGDGMQAAQVVRTACDPLRRRRPGRRSPDGLREAALRAVLRAARRSRGPWVRTDPLAPVPGSAREVLALRATVGLPLPAVAHLLDLPLGVVAAREAEGLRAAGCADLDALRTALRPWLDAEAVGEAGGEAAGQAPAPARAPSRPRTLAGLVAVAVLAAGGVLLVDAAPVAGPAARAVRVDAPEPEPLPARPDPGATGCADPRLEALCERPSPPPSLPGVALRGDTPFWPFTGDREAADWAAGQASRPWAADPVQVAQRLVDDLLALRGVRARGVGGGLVALQSGGREVGRVRLVRLGRGDTRPWSVVAVESPAVALDDVGELAPGAPARGTAGGPVDVRLLTPQGRELARAPALDRPLRWAPGWSVAALVAVRRDGTGLALRPVRRAGAVDPGVPAPGATFVGLVDGAVRLLDALDGRALLQVSDPEAGARDSDPSRGGRDAVVFVRTEADGCTSTVLRAALDRGAGGTTVERARLVRRLPRLSPSAQWLGWVEAPCTGGAGTLLLRGPDGRVRRLPLGTLAVSRLDVRDDGSAVLQLRGPDRVLDLPPGATALGAPLVPRPGCRDTAASATAAAALVWERCGDTARPVLVGRDGVRVPAGEPGPPVLESAVVEAPDGPLLLARTTTGAVVRSVGGRLVPVLPPCLRRPGCVTALDW